LAQPAGVDPQRIAFNLIDDVVHIGLAADTSLASDPITR
jgi:hypothetical protein